MTTPPKEGNARIRIRPNGPYLVEGDLPLSWKTPVHSEHSEPLTWQKSADVEHPPTYALCRCGGSANKPFCDGTHATAGFDGAETAGTQARSDRVKRYQGEGIVVDDDRSICEHAGFCGNKLTNVWKMVAGTADTAVRSQVMAMIERCPSGALTYRLNPEGEDVEPDLAQRISLVPDGPLFVSGGVSIETSTGERLEARNRVTLCRCGGSANKPFCDGTHKTNDFSHRPADGLTGAR
jgi:CDGSH-type Zn-finger protein